MSNHEIEEYLVRLEKEIKEFKEELFRISWYMRGGITIHELMHVYTAEDLDLISNVIKENVKNTQDSQMPLI
jgi:hypothetical protein